MAKDTPVPLDDAIRQAYQPYREIDISADKIVANLQKRRAFALEVRSLIKDTTISDDVICNQLLNVRRRGQDKGGLPRQRGKE